MSEIKKTCRGTSMLIEAATMTYEEYLNLHTQGAKELRAAYEALQKELGYSKMAADAEAEFANEYKAKFETLKAENEALHKQVEDIVKGIQKHFELSDSDLAILMSNFENGDSK